MKPETRIIEFKAERSQSKYCACDCCNDTTYITKISFPIAKYYDGKNLDVKYKSIWICDDCYKLMTRAVDIANAKPQFKRFVP